ncbi:hypothetical protein DPMN_173546 [Dreissena polymorpha]|uniref:Uncharacterized protein n=1 Tax=Dreissena polymorpha TaxID=45954 RepID=A0A9D4E324_DREPO|nr:hypothetical protein DPMN_173546 [Dreissena polymorpha]
MSAVSVKIFARDDFVDDFNGSSLLKWKCNLYEFQAKDSGTVAELGKITAPAVLWVKLGCPVILLTNLPGKLVNGLLGHIQHITHNGIVVEFSSIHISTIIERIEFTGMFIVIKEKLAFMHKNKCVL